MAGKDKSSKQVVEPVSKQVVEEAPKSKAKKVAEAVEKAEVVSPPVVVEEQTGGNSSEIKGHLESLGSQISSMTEGMKKLASEYKAVEKLVKKLEKESQKGGRKKKTSTMKGKMPSGFTKPCDISDDMCKFLGVSKGTKLTRNEVRAKVQTYINDNKLKDASNGTRFNPDAKLTKLFGFPAGEQVTIFQLQKYLSKHITKSVETKA